MNANNISKSDLGTVVMPLVDLLTSSGLSWSNRQAIACAIRETVRHHNSMESERQSALLRDVVGQGVSGAIQGAAMAQCRN